MKYQHGKKYINFYKTYRKILLDKSKAKNLSSWKKSYRSLDQG